MKEMVGGCCVCSDDRGWAENPLVYCDGQGCTVAVHQACYGIVTVPTGNWYCRKCESQERSTKVRCELCPSRDGALKPTDNNAWAHVVCALYIPEVRFGNVTTMEPIILHQIPQERYNKTCYICEEGNKGSRASVGACMQCNKAGCRQQFHVTCAQSLGLLCEEAGNYLDNVKYCGYCHHHYTKLVSTRPSLGKKKGGNVKPIPPYRPVPGGDSPEASPSKEHDPKLTAKRKMSTGGGSTSGGGKTKPDEGVIGLQGGLGGGGVPGGPGGLDEELSSLSLPPTSQPNIHPLSQESLNPEQAKLLAKKRKGGKSSQTGSPDPGSSPRPLTPGKPLPSPSNTSPSGGKPVGSIVVQVPLEAAMGGGATPLPHAASPPSADQPHDLPAKRARSQSSDKSDKSRRPKRGSGSGTTGGSSSGTSSGVLTSDRQLSTKISLNPTPPPSISTIKAGSPESIVETLQSLPRPKKTNIKEEKDIKLFQNGVSAPHMLGNQLNPSSTMAQKMCDTLSQEVAAHSIFSTEPNLSTSSNLVGPQLPKHHTQTGRAPSANSAASINLGAGGGLLGNPTNGVTWSNSIPQSLDQLLERQWEQGSQFLMEQAQHFDIASLLSCLHQLRAENAQLEEHVNSLLARRDHLLAVNARLAIPLVPPQVNSVHNNVGGGGGGAGGGRTAAVVENGLGETYHAAPRPPNQPNQPSARGGCTGAGYNLPAVTQSSVVVRASPDPQHRRVGSGVTPGGGAYTNALYSTGQASTSAQSQVVIRRSEVDSHAPNLPPSTKPS